MITKLGTASLLVLVSVACSSASEPAPIPGSNDSNQTGKSSSSSSSGGSSSSSSSSSSGSTPTPTDDAGTPSGDGCDTKTGEACYTCCDTAYPNQADILDQAFGDCACQAPGVCRSQCGSTYCAGKAPSTACETCLDNATQCDTAAEKACNATAACTSFLGCVDKCQP